VTPKQLSALKAYAQATHAGLCVAVRQAPTHATRTQTLYELLNGHPAEAVNEILGRPRRRREGLYFSGSRWGQLVADALPTERCERVVDPACGIGDLLLATARHLPLGPTLEATLRAWSSRLVGVDLHGPFLALAWHRLQALAMDRHGLVHPHLRLGTMCPASFRVANSLREKWRLRAGDGVVMNPPFQAIAAPLGTINGTGRVTAALAFLERAIGHAPPGVHVVALVPEVIRSGSRYARLRDWLAQRCQQLHFKAHGQFSEEANIDVALLVATTRSPTSRLILVDEANAASKAPAAAVVRRLGDVCSVHVGAVVPHRTRKNGPRQPYIAVVDVTPWEETSPTRTVGYRASTHAPPFVVVRRTSGPRDKERVRATIVRGEAPILVENHLLVLTPNVHSVRACRELAAALKRPQTSSWLNERIRCRHLTVGAVREIPLP